MLLSSVLLSSHLLSFGFSELRLLGSWHGLNYSAFEPKGDESKKKA